jgi:hypothetical protein
MEIAVISVRKKIKLKGFALHHTLTWNVRNINGGEIGLAGNGAKTCKFRTVKLYKIIVVGMLVNKRLKESGIIIKIVFGTLTSKLG